MVQAEHVSDEQAYGPVRSAGLSQTTLTPEVSDFQQISARDLSPKAGADLRHDTSEGEPQDDNAGAVGSETNFSVSPPIAALSVADSHVDSVMGVQPSQVETVLPAQTEDAPVVIGVRLPSQQSAAVDEDNVQKVQVFFVLSFRSLGFR